MEEYGNIIAEDVTGDGPDCFSWAVATVLTGLGAESYIRLFKKHNIGKNTLVELSNEDLIQLGVDSVTVRENIIKGVRSLPQYEDVLKEQIEYSRKMLDCTQAACIIRDSSNHVQRLHISILANKISLKKDPNPSDSLIFPDQYASGVALKTLNKIESLVETIESHILELGIKPKKNKTRKLFIGAIGGMTIAIIAYSFVRSLRNL